MSKISIYEYVADNNPQQVDALLQQFGYPATSNIPKLVKALKKEVSSGNEQILFSLADIHPDIDLIIQRLKAKQSSGKSFSACGACSLSCDGDSNCNCNKNKNTQPSYSADAIPPTPAPAPSAAAVPPGNEVMNVTPLMYALAATVLVSTVLIVAVSAMRNK